MSDDHANPLLYDQAMYYVAYFQRSICISQYPGLISESI